MHVPELKGKVTILTGASRGIGRGIALRFAREGAELILAARSKEALESVARECRELGGQATAIATDVSQRTEVDRLYDQVLARHDRVDILINNAGWASPIAHILEMDERHWDTVIGTNLKSVYLFCNRAANAMVDRRIRGSIVNISSFAAARAHRYMAA